MIFERYQPAVPIGKHIEVFIYFKDFSPGHSIERLVPTGHAFLVFELDGFTRNIFDNKTLKPSGHFTDAWISGVHRNFLSISAHQNSEMMAIQFKPSGPYPFLHIPLTQLADRVIPAIDLFGDAILNVRNEMLAADDIKEKFSIVERWLLSRFEVKKQASDHLFHFIHQLQSSSNANLKNLLETYPYTQKQLIEHFKKFVGLTPKYFHRIVRFNEILSKINLKENVSWAEIAYSCEYSDQSHFIKEFSLFSGFNPQEFIQIDFPADRKNFFPMDRKG